MTHPENGKTLWTEARVAALLEDFFEEEIPAALREESPVWNGPWERVSGPASPIQPPRTRNHSVAGFVSIGFSSLLMLMVAFLIMEGDNSPSDNSRMENPSRLPGEDSAPRGVSHERNPIDALNHDGRGPVELRPRIRHVGQGDPNETGDDIKFPELDIEIFPLEGEASDEKAPRNSELPESKGTNADRDPLPENRMPEKNRQLPESQAPQPPDPDEAALF